MTNRFSRLSHHGTIFLFQPFTEAARLHLEVCCPDATWFAGALVCEHRYARELAASLSSDGFTVE
jgi:hypothetical protein